MKHATHARALGIFKRAIDLEEPARTRFLVVECGGDEELTTAVEALLRADRSPDSLLERGLELSLASLAGGPALEVIGPYRIVRAIGSGGMGDVFEAWQERPRRRVALKTVRTRVRTKQGLERFRFEAEVLGSLCHPGIAQVYEAGTHVAGGRELPFIAMEFVPGARDLVTFAREERLSRRERLELFLAVCDAVQHGHQRGVIHRDLKPSNVLVSEAGEVKVIDFGLARLTDPEVERATLAETRPGQLVGTLHYMSPEQLRGQSGVDVRSDVYALGAVLFQLLADTHPFDLAGRPLTEVARIVAEEEARPLGSLDPRLRGDLEWIVARALERDLERRYPSVSELAEDLRRHLRDEPVLAGPPSAAYRARKLLRRHRVAVVASACVLAVAVTGLSTTWSQAVLAGERLAERNVQLEIASEASGFLERALRSIRPELARGDEVTLRDFVDQTAHELDRRPPGRPEVEASVRRTLGESYLAVGAPDRALPELEIALELESRLHGAGDPRTLETRLALARACVEGGRLEEGRERTAAVVGAAEAALGPRHPVVSQARLEHGLALLELSEYDAAAAELERVSEQAGDDAHRVRALKGLARVAVERGDLDRAVALHEEAVSERPAGRDELDPSRIEDLLDLASVRAEAGHHQVAAEGYRTVLPALERVYGADHPRTLVARARLAYTLTRSSTPAGATPLVDGLLAAFERVRGRETLRHTSAMYLTGLALLHTSRPHESVELLQAALDVHERRGGPPNLERFELAAALCVILPQVGELEQAEQILERSVRSSAEHLGESHWTRLDLARAQAQLETRRGDVRAAVEGLAPVVARFRIRYGDEHPKLLGGLDDLAVLSARAGKVELAVDCLQIVHRARARALGPGSRAALLTRAELGRWLGRAGRVDEARESLLEVIAAAESGATASATPGLQARIFLAELLLERGAVEEGRAQLEAALARLDSVGPSAALEAVCLGAGQALADDDPSRARELLELGEARASRAEPWLRAELQVLRADFLSRNATVPSDALAPLEEGLGTLATLLGPDHWRTQRASRWGASVRSRLGVRDD